MSMEAPKQRESVESLATKLANEFDTDVFLYNSPTTRQYDDEIVAACLERERRSKVLLILVSEGGDPDAAYRIARCFQDHYDKFTCLVPSYCKSAGTLITVGAHELVMTDFGELGPLDIQLVKKDELWETQSGLTVMSALDALKEKSFSTFEHYFMEIKKRSRDTVTFKTAAEIAIKLTAGLFSPIFQQIDPMHVGEASRAQAIAQHYGLRLAFCGKNISAENVDALISQYPAHGFVVDRTEAASLFNKVRKPNAAEEQLIKVLGDSASDILRETQTIRRFLSGEKRGVENVPTNGAAESSEESKSGEASADAGEGPERQAVVRRSAAASE